MQPSTYRCGKATTWIQHRLRAVAHTRPGPAALRRMGLLLGRSSAGLIQVNTTQYKTRPRKEGMIKNVQESLQTDSPEGLTHKELSMQAARAVSLGDLMPTFPPSGLCQMDAPIQCSLPEDAPTPTGRPTCVLSARVQVLVGLMMNR